MRRLRAGSRTESAIGTKPRCGRLSSGRSLLGPGHHPGGDTTLTFKKEAIGRGPGCRPRRNPKECGGGHLTRDDFSLTACRIASRYRAGPIAEMAQCFARFGSRVTLLERTGHVLPREDADAAEIVQRRMMNDGVQFIFDSKITRVESRGNEKAIYYEMHGSEKEVVVDQILVGIGRARC